MVHGFFGTIGTMVEYKDRLADAMRAAGTSTNALAQALGISYQAVKKVIDGKTRSFTAARNAEAAAFLRVNPTWLATGQGDRNSGVPEPTSKPEEGSSFGGRGGNIEGVPVIGSVRIGEATFEVEREENAGIVLGSAVIDGYAVRVDGDGGSPAMKDGQYLIVERHGHPAFSDFAIIETGTGDRLLVEFLADRGDRFTVETVGRGDRMTLAKDDVTSIDGVVAVVSPRQWRASDDS